MSQHLPLAVFDTDAAAASLDGEDASESRGDFLQKAVVAGGIVISGGILIGGLPTFAASAPSPEQDAEILNFALTLEYIEAAFYTETARKARVSPELLEFAKIVGAHERAHVAFLKKALGNKAVKKPKLDFGDTTTVSKKFAATAAKLEDTGVAAYNGQAANLTKPALAAAAKIVSVEARHAAWIRAIMGRNPAPAATDTPLSKAEATAALNKTSFIKAAS